MAPSSGGRSPKHDPSPSSPANHSAGQTHTEDGAGALAGRLSELEAELALYRHVIENLRQDMQAFAYSVSHDLRAPLRAIDGFARILVEDYGSELEGEAKVYLGHILNNSEQLSSQIEDLLFFYRLGKHSPRKVNLEMDSLISEVFSEQKALQPGCRAVLRKGELPDLQADPDLVRQVFAHLIGNALKATRDLESPQVEISGKVEEGARIYTVKDNGIGFGMDQAEKLFQVFQKMHSKEEFPGNGVGLAIVKRIVTAHGGCVSADSAPGQGCAIQVSLPHRPEDFAGVGAADGTSA